MSTTVQSTGCNATPPLAYHPSSKVWTVATTLSAVCLAFFIDTVWYESRGTQYLQQMCHKTADWSDAHVKPFVVSWYNTAEEHARPAIEYSKGVASEVAKVYRWATETPPPAESTSWTSYLWLWLL